MAATVVMVGPGLVLQSGARLPPECAVGNTVLVNDFVGFEVEINGEKLKCVKLGDIIAVAP